MPQVNTKDYLFRIFLITAGLVIFANQITLGELFFNNDETRHAMTGLFFHDFLCDAPSSLLAFKTYAWEYYARYPALGLLVWPPFFHIAEAAFFSVFGVSAFVARLTVLSFAIIGVLYWYQLIRSMYDERLAFFAGLFFIANPFITLYSKHVMLEIPSLTLCLMTLYYFHRYMAGERRVHLSAFAGCFALAILTKIHAVFMAPLFLLYLWRERKLHWLYRREVLIALGIGAFISGSYTAYAFKFQLGRYLMELTQGTAAEGSAWSLRALLFYPLSLSEQLGPVVLWTSLAYLILLLSRRALKREAIFIFWVLSVFAVFVVIAQKAPRFTIYWIPPFVLMAVLLLDWVLQFLRRPRLATSILAIISAGLLLQAYLTKREYLLGYEEAAKFVVQNHRPNTTVFFHGYYDGNLIFHVRKSDPARRIPVLVGTKMLAATNIFPSQWKVVTLMQDKSEIEQLFAEYGTRFIVMDDLDTVELSKKLPPIFDELRMLVQTADYALVKTIPIETNIPGYRGHSILIYENRKAVELQSNYIRFRMLTLGDREIYVKLQ
ncbi:MAG: glycosyltransferase family 39 protein [Acidobacteria bacterium]|nr:glycosyltransferase family 39 protein [Acidobacteriota bacterium]MBI3656054.1 glycosyltransferase family 39 protein [Acidobacteriota bacterium]